MISIDEIKKGGDFQVPEGYFEQFPVACLAKIKEADRKRSYRRRLISTVSSIAASLMVIVATAVGLTLLTQDQASDTGALTAYNSPMPAVDTTGITHLLAKNETHYEMENELEAAIIKNHPAPVYRSEQEAVVSAKSFDDGDYRIMEYYAEDIELESTF
jgi:hypothetical protein